MRSWYGLIRPVYRRYVPRRLRALAQDRRYPFHVFLDRIKDILVRGAEHDEIYDHEYFTKAVDPPIIRSASVMARSMVERYRPETVIDIGCGTGALLAAFRDAGVRGIGYEYAEAGIAIARSRGIDVRKFDLESDDRIPDRADLVVSTEVAEHLPAACADAFVRRLAECGETIVLTAATPGQGGADHVNEQPNSYWIAKFAEQGAEFQEDETLSLRAAWKRQDVQIFYAENVMVFRRSHAA